MYLRCKNASKKRFPDKGLKPLVHIKTYETASCFVLSIEFLKNPKKVLIILEKFLFLNSVF